MQVTPRPIAFKPIGLVSLDKPIGLYSMSKAQETRARIIQQAAELFNLKGYAGSSIADIMQATGLKKGGIYNHFTSKDELALAAFDFAVHQFQERYMSILRHHRHALERLQAVIDVFRETAENPPIPGGCPILNTAIESDDAHPALRDRTQQAMHSWHRLISHIVKKGVARGELRPTADGNTVATVLISTLEGANMMSKLYSDPTYLQQVVSHLVDYLNQLKP